jgi:hypothetical protein
MLSGLVGTAPELTPLSSTGQRYLRREAGRGVAGPTKKAERYGRIHAFDFRLMTPAESAIDSCKEFRNSLVPARTAGPIATATTKCDLLRSAPSKETKPS